MSDMLSLGLSGLRASQKALSTVSDNIANAQTPGFSRRSVRTEEGAPGGDNPLYKAQHTPGGVIYAGIYRHVDAALVADARVSVSASAQSASRLAWLEAAERDLNDDASGVGQAATRMFNIVDQLASSPDSTPLRKMFLQSIDDVATAVRDSAGSLAATADRLESDASLQVDQLNTDLRALHEVNGGLLRARKDSTNQASLLDERDKLLDQIAERVAVDIDLDEHGRASVRMSGPSSSELVTPEAVSAFSLSKAADGKISIMLDPGGVVSPQSGILGGIMLASDHLAAQRISLDRLALKFSTEINSSHQAGIDGNGNPGNALLSIGDGAESLFARPLGAESIAAADASSRNGNLLSFNTLRGKDGIEAGWDSLVSANATSVASARAQNSAASSRLDGAVAAREAVSAVDLDHEAAELLRFQQAYEASARVIQVARETILTIMNAF
jgi:flagellar hook-associated protein 1